ncbi:MAG: Flp family type IVb pilin [Actinomycetota bacterium]|nr:Flp family type IVb pilin [Actinomycetota bacterium]
MNAAMTRLYVAIVNVRDEEHGASAAEYGMMVALIAALIVGLVATLGGHVVDFFNDTNTALEGV